MGTFASLSLPSIGSSKAFRLLYGETNVSLEVALDGLLAGDYNGNGAVDASDYTVWRDMFGSAVTNAFEGADGNGDGVINSADYDIWKANFGTSAPGALESVEKAAVPEPSTALFLVLGIVSACLTCGIYESSWRAW